MKRVFDVTRDKQGTPVFRHLADVETWRDTHPYRRMQKYQRTLPDKTPITSAVYDGATGAFLCSPLRVRATLYISLRGGSGCLTCLISPPNSLRDLLSPEPPTSVDTRL